MEFIPTESAQAQSAELINKKKTLLEIINPKWNYSKKGNKATVRAIVRAIVKISLKTSLIN